jgi:hypothetical protein
MKTLRYFGFAILLIIAGCTKEKEEQKPVNDLKELTLDVVKRAYYNHQNMRYETNTFSADSTTFTYLISVETGKKYRVLIHGLFMEDVELILAKPDSDEPLAAGVQANVGNTAKYFVYEATNTEKLELNIATNDSNLFGQDFYLTFEEMGTYQIAWNGFTWLCDGDWEVNNDGNLVVKGYKSGFSKWAQLLDTTLTDFRAELDFETMNGSLPFFIGLALNANTEIFTMINLPSICRQFKISEQRNWEYWVINMGNGGGIGRDLGYFPQALTSGANTLSVINTTDSSEWKINQTTIVKKESQTGFHGFFLTFEDTEKDSVAFRGIRFN